MTSDDYVACVAVYPTGTIRRANVRFIRLMNVEEAIRRLREDQAAYVRPDDVAAVKEAMQWGE